MKKIFIFFSFFSFLFLSSVLIFETINYKNKMDKINQISCVINYKILHEEKINYVIDEKYLITIFNETGKQEDIKLGSNTVLVYSISFDYEFLTIKSHKRLEKFYYLYLRSYF